MAQKMRSRSPRLISDAGKKEEQDGFCGVKAFGSVISARGKPSQPTYPFARRTSLPVANLKINLALGTRVSWGLDWSDSGKAVRRSVSVIAGEPRRRHGGGQSTRLP